MWRPIVSKPQLCTLKELQDGTYSIDDLADMHEALDMQVAVEKIFKKRHDARAAAEAARG